jgi:hypothetical protein
LNHRSMSLSMSPIFSRVCRKFFRFSIILNLPDCSCPSLKRSAV